MRITRNPAKKEDKKEETSEIIEETCNTSENTVEAVSEEDVLCQAYCDAKNHIMSAIETLGSISNIDSSAKDAIANLSVVYFDIQ